jgi:hypothetical protein
MGVSVRVAALVFAWLALAGFVVRFVEPLQMPAGDLPIEARRSRGPDILDHGPLGRLIGGRLVTAEVTWWDRRLFGSESRTRDYLDRLLTSPRGSTVQHLPWAQMLPVPSVAADIVESDGERSHLLVWHAWPSVYAAWYDGGHWWFAYWMQNEDLRLPGDPR